MISSVPSSTSGPAIPTSYVPNAETTLYNPTNVSTLTTLASLRAELNYSWWAWIWGIPKKVEILCAEIQQAISDTRKMKELGVNSYKDVLVVMNDTLYKKNQRITFIIDDDFSAEKEQECLNQIRQFCKGHNIALDSYHHFGIITKNHQAVLQIDILIPDNIPY